MYGTATSLLAGYRGKGVAYKKMRLADWMMKSTLF